MLEIMFVPLGDIMRMPTRLTCYCGAPEASGRFCMAPPGLMASRTSRDWSQSTLPAFELRCGDTCGKNEMTHEQKRAGALNGR